MWTSILHKTRRSLRALRERGGNALITAAVALPAIVAGAGLAVDAGIVYMVKNRVSKALDSSGLAAGRGDLEQATADARAYFDANYPPGYLGSNLQSFTVNTDANQEYITVTAQVEVPTYFMHLFGYNRVEVSERAVVQRLLRGAEIALVLDVTGSMRGSGKIDAMKDAATELIEIMFGSNETQENLWVSIIPYTATMNIGTQHWDWLAAGDRVNSSPADFDPTDWKGCVEARPDDEDQTDTPPNLYPFTSYFWAPSEIDNDWEPVDESNSAQNNGTGPNLGCGPAITSLTNVKQELLDAVDELLPWHRGGTASNLGLVWGWRTISPRWRGLWTGGSTPSEQPLDYGTPLMDKVVIVMTDGVNQFYAWKGSNSPQGSDYTAYGRLQDFTGDPNSDFEDGQDILDSRFAATCQAMADEGIIIYTITFGGTPDTQTRQLYENCAANGGDYYHAPDNQTLREAFRQIGEKLSNLRLVE